MLHNVPEAINRMTRNIVINHPNTYNAIMFRKRVLRTGPETVGGLPTLGGLGVINSEDESEFTYDLLGNAYAMKAEQFESGTMMDRQDANTGDAQEFRYLIEPEIQDGLQGGFSVKKNDVMYLVLGDVRLAYEVVSIGTKSDIPPYNQFYICNIRNDLHTVVLEGSANATATANGAL
jgi:hypothetical protein